MAVRFSTIGYSCVFTYWRLGISRDAYFVDYTIFIIWISNIIPATHLSRTLLFIPSCNMLYSNSRPGKNLYSKSSPRARETGGKYLNGGKQRQRVLRTIHKEKQLETRRPYRGRFHMSHLPHEQNFSRRIILSVFRVRLSGMCQTCWTSTWMVPAVHMLVVGRWFRNSSIRPHEDSKREHCFD